jgi:copper chaperone
MKTATLQIDGMSCGHCLNAVNRALATLPGVAPEWVQIGRASVRYDESVITPDAIRDAVAAAGYRATVI